MIAENNLSIIPVKKDRLLADLKKNLAAHEVELKQAKIDFQEAVVLELTKMLESAKEGKKITLAVELSPPPDNTKEYERVISMLEYTTSEEIKITEQEFRKYVQDEWTYKAQMNYSNAQYRETLSSRR